MTIYLFKDVGLGRSHAHVQVFMFSYPLRMFKGCSYYVYAIFTAALTFIQYVFM